MVDLPPITEVERICVLGTKQKRLYDALALAVRQAVKKDIRKRGLARSRLSVLTAILRLRQMACDPRLVDPDSSSESAKREAFLDLARELAYEGRRALVFSQFVELFTLWRADLDREGIAYEYLDGASTGREAIVQRFQTGTSPLFLVSLKAGGVGLNLTAADTVILCDPWWNPAVEDQAAGRAHRIGQARAVTVVRLIAAGTIEEKIGALKAKKRELAALVGSDVDELEAEPRGERDSITLEDVERLLGSFGHDVEAPPIVEASSGSSSSSAKAPLTPLQIDEVRDLARLLVESGLDKRVVARRMGIAVSRLSLLLVGHRIPLTRAAADRIRVVHEERWGNLPAT